MGYSDRPQTIRCSDEHKVAFKDMAEDQDGDSDDEQSEETADDSKDMVAHDTQMRYSPSFFLDSTQVCVEMDVNRPKEKGQPVMEVTQLRSAQQTASQATRQASESELKSSGSQALDLVHRGGKLSGGKTRRGREGCRSMESSLSPSPTLNRIQCSRHVQGVLRCGGQRWKGPKQSGEGCAGEGEARTP